MKKIFYLIALILFWITIPVSAEEIGFREYTIKKGDTLWDISNNELDNPFFWPRLWQENPHIKDPDLIFPNDKIRIPPKERLISVIKPAVKETPSTTVVSKPEIKPEIKEVLKEIPKRYIIDKNLFIGSGWISKEFPSIGEIITSLDARILVGKNEIIFLKTSIKADSGDRFLVIRNVKEVKHPKTNDTLGYLIKVPGIVEVIEKKDNLLKAKVIVSYEEIEIGDGLLPYKELEPPLAPVIARTPDISGYIVASSRNSELVTTGDIVFLDKGENHGVRIGDVFSVFAETTTTTPIAKLQIVDLKPEISKAVLLNALQEVTIGERWGKE
jgi:hypothetical protein